MSSQPVVHVVGARPQFIKASVVVQAAPETQRTVIVHTGQHYDPQLSEVFFRELDIPSPDYHLGVGSGPHGQQTGAMMAAFEQTLLGLPKGVVVVYGDTNSTLAGALVAAKLGWPVAHVEAGLRSFDRAMPEELNRVAVDHVSDLLLCPTEQAVTQLATEGLATRALFTGDVMFDAALAMAQRAQSSPVGRYLASPDTVERPAPFRASDPGALRAGSYAVATLHRAQNTDDPQRLARLIQALGQLPWPVVMPLHPRTKAAMDRDGLRPAGGLVCVDPVGYLDFAALLAGSLHVFTDSGGVQKEAIFNGRLCTTMRNTSEWPETFEDGWNVLVDDDPEALHQAATRPTPDSPPPTAAFGDGKAGDLVSHAIASLIDQ